MIKTILKSILAGVLIALAGIVYLNCTDKIVGSLLFSLGLISVILLEANLFTGKIGYVNSKRSILESLVILIFNLVAATIVGLIYRCSSDAAAPIVESKLLVFSESWWLTGLKAIGCGAAIYLAVEGYKKSKSLIPVILGVMVFILAGWNHCIADCFYIAAGSTNALSLLYLLVVIVGNSIGSLMIRGLQVGWEKKNELH
jgi:formate/nitrite transporter FocA (FNT family)